MISHALYDETQKIYYFFFNSDWENKSGIFKHNPDRFYKN